MRQDTDVLAVPHGQDLNTAWSADHPSQPVHDRHGPEPMPKRRVRPRPHRRYTEPEEMWAWHWVRMRVVLAWTVVLVACGTALTAGTVILSEFI